MLTDISSIKIHKTFAHKTAKQIWNVSLTPVVLNSHFDKSMKVKWLVSTFLALVSWIPVSHQGWRWNHPGRAHITLILCIMSTDWWLTACLRCMTRWSPNQHYTLPNDEWQVMILVLCHMRTEEGSLVSALICAALISLTGLWAHYSWTDVADKVLLLSETLL